MKNTSEDLCNHLFSALERLNDESLEGKELEQEIKRAHAVRNVADGVIGMAKAETDRIKAIADTGLTSDTSLMKKAGRALEHKQ